MGKILLALGNYIELANINYFSVTFHTILVLTSSPGVVPADHSNSSDIELLRCIKKVL